MKVHLMYPDKDFDAQQELPSHTDDLIADLQLGAVLLAMAGGDKLKWEVARTAIMVGCDLPEQVAYRHEVLTDCARNRDTITQLYELAGAVLEDRRRIHRSSWFTTADSKLSMSVSVLDACLPYLRQLREIADTVGPRFTSRGFRSLFTSMRGELDRAYVDCVAEQLQRLRFHEGMMLSAALGEGNTGVDFILRSPDPGKRTLFRRVPLLRPTRSFTIAPRDEASHNALGELRSRAVFSAAAAASESVSHVIDFITLLRQELAFYLGCLNLDAALTGLGQETCLPTIDPAGTPRHTASKLYDAGLALDSGRYAVPSDLDAEDAPIVLITGANRGGKSTFLRAIGIAVLLMRCGCCVPAHAYRAPLFPGIHTHFRREEDEELASGKFDEELVRMHTLTEQVRPGSLVLSNESFSSTNEREGSQIAEDILRALAHAGVQVVMVTHLYELAERLRSGVAVTDGRSPTKVTFLRAQRGEGGRRPFRIVPGAPEPTSFAADLYEQVFSTDPVRQV